MTLWRIAKEIVFKFCKVAIILMMCLYSIMCYACLGFHVAARCPIQHYSMIYNVCASSVYMLHFQLPNAAAGYDLSRFFFMPVTELLLELPLEPSSLPIPLPLTSLRPGGPSSAGPIISAGRSFHSVSERWF